MPNDHRFADAVKVASTRERAVELLHDARRQGKSILPCGNGTRLQRFLPHADPDRWLSVAGMKEMLWLDAEDQTCAVEAGMSPAELLEILAPHDLQLDVLCPNMEQGTLGGLFLSREQSLLAGSCGPIRDQVLGATWLLADGSIVKSGARVVKSVAGYDVTRLLLGSRGRLAICLDLTLRLRPKAPARSWFHLARDAWHRRGTSFPEPRLAIPSSSGDDRMLLAYTDFLPEVEGLQVVEEATAEAALDTYLQLLASGALDPPLPPDSPWLAQVAEACAPGTPPFGGIR
ncbi:MAG: FAD-binding oxidoreductase [Planctomycetota bacterium]